MTREEVVQAALTVERWCKEHKKDSGECECPFRVFMSREINPNWIAIKDWCVLDNGEPNWWNLEEYLRTRGLKHD